MELGLDRIQTVFDQLKLSSGSVQIVSIAGTNGKGSTVACLESILLAAGHRTGSYTSPHLIRYNERIRINGKEVSDSDLCEAFEEVEVARGDIHLTYFEFGTLAALQIFFTAQLDIVLLEVGLGGRLDAVNIVDSDIAVITAVDIDHTDWLGSTREEIGVEKAGIFRSGRPAICSDPNPPNSISIEAKKNNTKLYQFGVDFSYSNNNGEWSWQGFDRSYMNLPKLRLLGNHQLENASAALAVLSLMHEKVSVDERAICAGLKNLDLPGRTQIIKGQPELILDVAHNPHAIAVLQNFITEHPSQSKTFAVLGMLRDKDIHSSLKLMMSVVDQWYLADLTGSRAATADNLESVLVGLGNTTPVKCFNSVDLAYRTAKAESSADDQILIFGSFQTVGVILAQL